MDLVAIAYMTSCTLADYDKMWTGDEAPGELYYDLHSWQKIAETFEQKRNFRALSSYNVRW